MMYAAKDVHSGPVIMNQLMNAFLAAFRAGRLDEAEHTARRLVAIDGTNVRSLQALASVLMLRRKPGEAVDLLATAAKTRPRNAGILSLLGAALLADKRPDEALVPAGNAAAYKPRDPDVLNNLANAQQAAGRLEESVETYRKALSQKPEHPDALYNLGGALHALKRSDQAIEAYRKALALRPGNPAALNNLGLALHAVGEFDEAAEAFTKAAKLAPRWPQVHHNLGDSLQAQGKFAEATACYERVLQLGGESPETLVNLGNALERQGRLDAAEGAYGRAYQINPENGLVLNNIANVLEMQDRIEEAVKIYRRAIEVSGPNARLHGNLGVALQQVGALDEAVESYRSALSLAPDDSTVAVNLSTALLLRGDWNEGWRYHERRIGRPGSTFAIPALPRWTGPGSAQGPVLLMPEQGLGDMIQFARFAPMLEGKGIPAILQVWPKLASLFKGLPPGTRTVRSDAPIPRDAASWCPVMSVPAALGLDEATLGGGAPYLVADPKRVAAWADRIGTKGFRIGIAWQGSPRAVRLNRGRSIALAEFAPLTRLPGVRLIALQAGVGVEQIATVPFPVEQPGHGFDSGQDAFVDAAALMMSLDLVITSDTSIAHLAGALGVPVFVALKAVPDWRWMRDREDTPWYASARLFRQARRGDWHDVFRRITAAVGDRIPPV